MENRLALLRVTYLRYMLTVLSYVCDEKPGSLKLALSTISRLA